MLNYTNNMSLTSRVLKHEKPTNTIPCVINVQKRTKEQVKK